MLSAPSKLDFSLILGCYNGGPELEERIRRLSRYLQRLEGSFEIIVVDDGSRDESALTLEKLSETDSQVLLLRNAENRGKGYSIRKGIEHASGRLIVFTDIDMAYSMDNIGDVLEELESGHPLVAGNRRMDESLYTVNNTLVRYVHRRHRIGLAFNLLVRLLFGMRVRDTQSGLKGFDRSAAEAIFRKVYTNGFLFDIEIFIRAHRLGMPVVEIPVHVSYTSDESTVSHFRTFFSLVPELLRIKAMDLRRMYTDGVSDRAEAERSDATERGARETVAGG